MRHLQQAGRLAAGGGSGGVAFTASAYPLKCVIAAALRSLRLSLANLLASERGVGGGGAVATGVGVGTAGASKQILQLKHLADVLYVPAKRQDGRKQRRVGRATAPAVFLSSCSTALSRFFLAFLASASSFFLAWSSLAVTLLSAAETAWSTAAESCVAEYCKFTLAWLVAAKPPLETPLPPLPPPLLVVAFGRH